VYKIFDKKLILSLNIQGNPIEKHPKANFEFLNSIFFNLQEFNGIIHKKIKKVCKSINSSSYTSSQSLMSKDQNVEVLSKDSERNPL